MEREPSDRIEMPVSIAPIDELVPDAGVEDQVLLRAIRACILPPTHNRAAPDPVWRRLGGGRQGRSQEQDGACSCCAVLKSERR